MKKIFALIFPVIIVLASCNNATKSGDTIDLKFNLPAGSSYEYNMDMDMAMKGNFNGQETSVNNKIGMGYRFSCLSDSSGWKKLKSTISRIVMNIHTGGVNINYDSDKTPDTSDIVSSTMGNVLGALKGGEFYFTMNEKGKVGSVSGIDAMMQKMMASVNAPGASAMAAGMGNSFNEENFKQNIQQAFAIYPDKPVKPGDSWSDTTQMNNQGLNMVMNNTYTLESVTGNMANVKVNSKISSPASTGFAGTLTGTMKYDVPTGVPTDGNLDMNMNVVAGATAQSTPMNIDMKMKITGKKL